MNTNIDPQSMATARPEEYLIIIHGTVLQVKTEGVTVDSEIMALFLS